MSERDPHEILWQAPEFEHRPKTANWYWISIIAAVLLIALAVWQKNYVFAVFVVVAELLLLVVGSREPRMVSFKLTSKGLTIGGEKFYPFSDIVSWSVDGQGFFDDEWPDVFIRLKHHFHTGFRMKVPRALIAEVERVMKAHAKEVPFEPTATDVLEKFLGF